MKRMITGLACIGMTLGALGTALGAEPQLLPMPQSVRVGAGAFTINATTPIVATDPSLAPLAEVLRQEIRLATGLQLPTATGTAGNPQIVLRLGNVPNGEEAYRLEVTPESALITANTYQGAAWGTVTLLQAIDRSGEGFSLPRMVIDDAPRYAYRGFMKDVARQDVPIEQLYAAVNLCRLYKVRYLHLHLSDDHAFVFPSTKYPQLGNRNSGAHSGPAPKVYDLQQLKDLVRYADERGVTLIPEIDGPGHTDAMRKSMPAELDSPRQPGGGARLGLLNMCNERMYEVMDDLIGEVAEVFASSPYIHIGADEVNTGAIKGAAEYEDFIKQHGMKGPHEVFVYYTTRVTDMVAKRGKKAIAWEGVPLDKADPEKLIYMSWTMQRSHGAASAMKRGMMVIDAPNHAFRGQQEIADKRAFLDPLIYNFQRELSAFQVKDPERFAETGHLLLGTQINDWESTWEYTLPVARRALAAGSANAWKSTVGQPIDDLIRRFEATDALLSRLVEPVVIELQRQDTYDQSVAVQLLRTNTLFTKPITLNARSAIDGAVVRFTTDNTLPTADSPELIKPQTFEETTTVWLGLFDHAGNKLAPFQRIPFEKVNYAESLATGKPVKVSDQEGKKQDTRPYLVDGFAKFDIWRGWWGAAPTPQWAQVDLEEEMTINRIEIFPYWDGHRSYQYTISVSSDEQNWTMVVDESNNRKRSTPDGFEHTFEPVKARYVKVDVLKNTANHAAHIVDLRVYGP